MKQLILFFFIFSFQNVEAKLPKSVYEEINTMSLKKLDEKSDFEMIKKNLQNLIILDDEDPSRVAVEALCESYNKNQKLYDKAFDAIQTKKNHKKIQELKALLKSFYREGNG